MGKERVLTKKITDALKSEFGRKVWVFKAVGDPRQRAGVPDILLCASGRFIALEVKVPGKESNTTALQDEVMDRIARARGWVKVISSVDEAITITQKVIDMDERSYHYGEDE